MLRKLLITGGTLRPNGFELGEGKYYGAAKLLLLDLESGVVEELLNVSEGNDNFPIEYPNLEFTAACIDGDMLWLPTDTEIRLYSYPSIILEKTFSHKCFHNIHSVAVRGNQLFVTATGTDMVVILDKSDGEILAQFNVEGKSLWHRFSESVDYRKLHSTRPHDCHPNYIFWISESVWVTRCTQEDAVCLSDMSKRIDISGPNKKISVHDGIVSGDKVYFTTVDGCIVVASVTSFEVVETINLVELEGYGNVRGWCRGLLVDNGIFYVGFSVLRKTRKLDKIKWLGSFLGNDESEKTCSVLAIDMSKRKIVADYKIPKIMLDAVYSILPEPKV